MMNCVNSIPGFSLVGKNLLPLALKFKNYVSTNEAGDPNIFDKKIMDMNEQQLIDTYRSVTGDSEKDICELASKDVTVENLRILVHLTLEYTKERKAEIDAEALEDLENALDSSPDDVPAKKFRKSLSNFTGNFFKDKKSNDFAMNALMSMYQGAHEEEDGDFLKYIEKQGPNSMSQKVAEYMTGEYLKRSDEALLRASEVKDLPVEDTIWLLDELCQVEEETGQVMTALIVQDKRSMILGNYMTKPGSGKTLAEQCHDLIVICALAPMEGVPRRPRSVTCKEPSFAERAVGLDLTDLGIKYMYAGIVAQDKTEYIRMRQCCVCGKRGSKGLFKKCSSCQAMLYCSKKCQKEDWSMSGDMAPHSHKFWCKKMKMYMSKTTQLSQFPFTFAEETCSENFDALQYKSFLEKHGVCNTGYWRREARTPGLHCNCECCVPYGEISACEDGIVLPVESTVLSEPLPDETNQNITDWKSYYQYRGFRMDSPIAVLLQWPLTVYAIVKYHLPNDYFEWWDGLDGGTLLIDILGVEKEVEMLDLFMELGYLLLDMSIDIVMYGAEISNKVNNKTFEQGNVKIKVKQGLYHRKADPGRKSNLVIGFNAGLGAYRGWSQTLVKLRTDKTPAYFTDYCQYSCECAKEAVKKLGIGTITEPIINPFRSPIRKLASENDMPWFSNGFLYHVVYP